MRRAVHVVTLTALLVPLVWSLVPSPLMAQTVLPLNPHVPRGPGRAPDRCVDVLFLGFRGSGEHPRGRTRSGMPAPEAPLPWQAADFTNPAVDRQRDRYGVTAAEDRLGTTLGALYEALHRRIVVQGRTVGFWSVGVDDSPGFGYGALYGAPPVDVANLDRYLDSIALDSLSVGLTRQLEALVVGGPERPAHCPTTELVVAGFSQGAVVARAVVLNLHDRLMRQGRSTSPVADVILVGDPLFRRQEHRRHGVVHPSDHQVDGLLRVDLVSLCDRNHLTRVVCAATALGTSRARSWFRDVWASLREFARMHPRLLRTSTTDLAQMGSGVHVICDSGDVVCSPLRIVSTWRWESDLADLLLLRPEQTLHGSYDHRVPWDTVVARLRDPRV